MESCCVNLRDDLNRRPSRVEMKAVFRMCRANQWNSVLNSIRRNRQIQMTTITMDNNISTTILHQAITSKGDTKKRATVIREILQVTPCAASIKNGYGSLPLHVICQRNVRMDSATKEDLIRNLINVYPRSLTEQGGVGKRTPLHIVFTDYISPQLTGTMIRNGREACFMRDKNGYLPAHVACSRHCSPEKLEMLLDVNPASIFEKTKDGNTLLTLARAKATKSHPNFALISEIERRIEFSSVKGTVSTAMTTQSDRFGFRIRFEEKTQQKLHNPIESNIQSIPNGNLSFMQGRKRKQSKMLVDEIRDWKKIINDKVITTEIQEGDGKPIIKKEENDPANLLLHFSRHMDKVTSV